MRLSKEKMVDEVVNRIAAGDVKPWKAEALLLKEYGVIPPEHYRLAVLSRRKLIRDLTGYEFSYLEMPDKPYLMKWRCPKDGSIWHLEARDRDTVCSSCGSVLEPYGTHGERFLPLAVNYVGGIEEYYSYAGQIKVFGDVKKMFTILLAYGIGVGPLGISAGCFRCHHLPGAIPETTRLGRSGRTWAGLRTHSILAPVQRLTGEDLLHGDIGCPSRNTLTGIRGSTRNARCAMAQFLPRGFRLLRVEVN